MQIDPFVQENLFFLLVLYVLAAIGYTLIARSILAFFIASDSEMVLWRVVCQLTDPFIRAFRPITPRFLLPALIPMYVAFWFLIPFRFIWWVIANHLGFGPDVPDVPG